MMCEAKCAIAGHCCVGLLSSCQKPSCAMGCAAATALEAHHSTTAEALCNASCTKAANDSQIWAPATHHAQQYVAGFPWGLQQQSLAVNATQCTFAVPNTNISFQMCGVCPYVRSPSWWPAAAVPLAPGTPPGFWPPGYSLPFCNSCEALGGDPAGECKLGCLFAMRPALKPTPPAPPMPPPSRGPPPACGPLPSSPNAGHPPYFSPCADTQAKGGLGFSSVFGASMVLQRAPARAAVYGYLGKLKLGARGASAVTVTVTASGSAESNAAASYTLQAEVDEDAGTWKAYLRPTAAAKTDTFTITATCVSSTGGCYGTATIDDVVFVRPAARACYRSSRLAHLQTAVLTYLISSFDHVLCSAVIRATSGTAPVRCVAS